MIQNANYLKGLNEKQREAAACIEGPLLILAGAGSGKTATMTRRIAYMVQHEGIRPYNILAVTFTNKAAREMRARVAALIGEDACRGMWITTFHSACLRILRFHAEDAGYAPGFTIYDPVDQKTIIKRCIREANVNEKMFAPAAVLHVISDAKEKGMDSEAFSRNAGSFRDRTIADLYARYETVLRKNNAIDFDDMIWKVVDLFDRRPDILEYYRDKFRYVMVDEYQDTNTMQYHFVKALAADHHNICVVGDDDQCIYQWRGADIQNILGFEQDFPNTKVIKLEQNYRSTGNILKAAHSVISNNTERKEKRLWTDTEDGGLITYRRLENEKEEARYVREQIEEQAIGGRRRYGDFAVLYRTNAQSRTFEEYLSRAGIPYVVRGSLRFYDRKEIKDMLAYMRLVVNPDDDVALTRVINEPKRGVGDRTLDKIRIIAGQNGMSILQQMTDEDLVGSLSARAAAGIRSFVRLIYECNQSMEEWSASDIYDRLLDGSGYLSALEHAGTDEADSRIENLMEFKSAIRDRENELDREDEDENRELSLMEFLDDLSLDADMEKDDGGTDPDDDDKVVLMTLHSAKGLEFPVVFMPGMEDGLFPGWRAMDSQSGVEEERRLCYVGITRAEEKLYMTSANTRTLYGKMDYTRESMFLSEIDPSLVDDQTERAVSGRAGYPDRNPASSTTHWSRNHKPFDPVRAQAAEVRKRSSDMRKQQNTGAGVNYRAGMRVHHDKFGDGMVLEVEGSVVVVLFDRVGKKKLAAGVAKLDILS